MKLKIINALVFLFFSVEVSANCAQKKGALTVECDFEAKKTDANAAILTEYLGFEITIEGKNDEADQEKELYKIFSSIGYRCTAIVSLGKTKIFNIPTVEKRDKICDLLEKDLD